MYRHTHIYIYVQCMWVPRNIIVYIPSLLPQITADLV